MRLREAARVGGAILIAAVAGCAAGPGSPAATERTTAPPSAAASATAAATPIDAGTWIEFSSVRHGYTIQHPPDWAATPGTARWGVNAISLPGSPVLDELDGSDIRFVAASQPIPADLSDEAWMQAYADLLVAANPQCGRPLAEWEAATIDGHEGAFVETCELFAVVTSDGRGYEFRMLGDLDVALFEALLDTVTLRPEASDDS